jgi:hypothetical protein
MGARCGRRGFSDEARALVEHVWALMLYMASLPRKKALSSLEAVAIHQYALEVCGVVGSTQDCPAGERGLLRRPWTTLVRSLR